VCCVQEVGAAISRALKDGVVKRSDLFVTTKVWNDVHTRPLALQSVRDSLADLQLDYLDLVLIHWPVNFVNQGPGGSPFPKDAAGVVINETDPSKASVQLCWQGLEDAVGAGLTRAIGVSNFSPAQCDELLAYASVKPACNQVEVHPYLPQKELAAYLKAKAMAMVAYSPLGNLRAAGAEDVTPLNDEAVKAAAAKHNKTPAQVVLRWGVQRGHAVLPKSITESRIVSNIQLADFVLDDEDMAAIDALGAKQQRFINPSFNVNGSNVFPA